MEGANANPSRAAYLSRGRLADKAGGLALSRAIELQAKALDVRVGCGAVVPLIALHLADLNHREPASISELAIGSREGAGVDATNSMRGLEWERPWG